MDQTAQPAVHLVTLAATGAAAIGIGIAVGLGTRAGSGDLTGHKLLGEYARRNGHAA